MWKLLKKLVEKWACHHQWGLEVERNVNGGMYRASYTSYTYICKNCGKFKRWKSS